MVYTKEEKLVELIREGGEEILKVNYESISYVPSIEDNPLVMMDAIEKLGENPSAARITFSQRRRYNYSYEQTKMLIEIGAIYNYFVKSKRAISIQNLGLPTDSPELLGQRLSTVQYLLFTLLKQDPLAAYAELKRVIRREKINFKTIEEKNYKDSVILYLRILEDVYSQLDKTLLVAQAREYLAGYTPGEREAYRLLFQPTITPDFMYTKIAASPPHDGHQLEIYKINPMTDVVIYRIKEDLKNLYHITPPEFKMTEDKYDLIDLAKKVLSEHQPRTEEFLDPEKMRGTFTNIGKDLLRELAEQKGMLLRPEEVEEMTEILVRHTIGFGIIELLLEDERIQDITINAPMGQVPIFVLHQEYNECVTNIIPTATDFESWATKFRLISGRPLDEANPILDTEIITPKARSRLSIIGKPLNPYGYGMSFRRHRDTPWTLPLFIKNGMISPLGAGLLSFTIDGARAHLIAGTRSSGKCLKGEELVQLSNGDLIKIRDIVEQSLKENGSAECDDGYYGFVNNIEILTTNANLEIIPKSVTCVWKRKSPEKLYQMKLKSGKVVTTTAEHPVLSMDKDFFGYKRSDELHQGMRVGTPKKMSLCFSKKANLNVKEEDFNWKTNAKRIRIPKEITKDLLEFIGYILGDGHVFKGGVQFINSNKVLRERFLFILKKEFQIIGKLRVDKRNNLPFIEVHSRNLARYLSTVFGIPIGNKSGSIFLPEFILKSPNEDLSILLRALYDCDGYVAKANRELEYSTKSKKLAQQIQLILSRFGIISFKRQKRVNGEYYNSIFIYGTPCNLFKDQIGFLHPQKQEKLDFLVAKKYLETTNIDSVPYGNYLIKELRKSLRVSPSQLRENTGKDYWAYETESYNVTKPWLKKFVSFYEERYSLLKKEKEEIDQVRKFSALLESRKEYVLAIKGLCKILDISQEDLTKNLDKPIRNTFFEEEPQFLEALFYFKEIIPAFEEKATKFINPCEETVEQFIKDTNLKYAQIAKEIGVGESTIKYYRTRSLKQTNPQLERYFFNFKNLELKELQKRFLPMYKTVLRMTKLMDEVNVQKCLKKVEDLRILLNIENEEYQNSSVSNFFNKTYSRTNLNTLSKITKKSLEVYDSAIGKEVDELLQIAHKVCSDDIFWDEVVEVEKVTSDQEWVYDLTVEPTHNFIANGVVVHNTSFLGSLLLEIMRKYRVLTIEDTLEIPTEAMRKLGYNIQPLKVRSALVKGGAEIPADEGIRTSLRLGDSALIIGEIRSKEASALYEAMRIGASANVVAGTIHGDSPYGVFDRVVNDLEVPRTSFKATDLIVMCNPIRTADGLHKVRRVTSITEVRKEWEEDPLTEHGFVDLMRYNAKTDQLEPTPELMNGESEILKAIGANVKEWVGNWDAIWNNIVLRGELKRILVEYATNAKMLELLEAEFVLQGNDMYYRIAERVQNEQGFLDTKKIKEEWEEWLREEIRKKQIKR